MKRSALLRLGALAVALAAVGCEVPLDPIDRGGRAFSMSGYLDTEADTNWVRIEPLGTTFEPVEGPIDAQVVLQGPHGVAPFTQVVRQFRSGTAHLFWTTAPVAPGQTYTVVATAADGASARARVATPAATPAPELVDGPTQCPTRFIYRGAGRVGDAFVTYTIAEPMRRVVRFSRFRQLVRTAEGVEATAYYGSDALDMDRDPFGVLDPALSAEIALAVVTDAWPEMTDLETALIPRDNPDIEGGVGFVGGATVFRRSFQPGVIAPPFQPAEPCFEFGRDGR